MGALNSSGRNAEYDELWVQFRPRGSKDVFDAAEAAIEVADQVVEDAGWGDDVHTRGVSDSDAGPVVFLRRAGHEPGLLPGWRHSPTTWRALGRPARLPPRRWRASPAERAAM